MNENKFKLSNHEAISDFLAYGYHDEDNISNSIKATIAQFLLCVRSRIKHQSNKEGYLTNLDLVNAQIRELRECIIDLEKTKEILTKGVILQ